MSIISSPKKFYRNSLMSLALITPVAVNGFVIDYNTAAGSTFLVSWSLLDGQMDKPGGTVNNTGFDLTGEALFTFNGANTTTNIIDIDIRLTNTTAANTVNAGLNKFGFATTPNATSVTFNDLDDGEIIDGFLGSANEFVDKNIIDVTAYSDGGAPHSLQSGEFDLFNLQIGFTNLVFNEFSVEFSPFNVKYQTDAGSFEFRDCSGDCTQVTEPGPMFLLGIGLVGLALARKKSAL